jgi:NADPH:quinone reductase-like Zn-dependent oxidoreductase
LGIVRTVRFHELGGPEVLKVEELAEPQPGPGEVRLRVQAIGLNRAEALFRRGEYMQKPELPSRIGYDAVGVVDAVGPGVTGLRVGERAATVPAFLMSRHGVYADEAVVPAHAIVPWPASLRAEEAAALWTAWLTAWAGMIKRGELRRGDWVLLTAAASSVGLAAIQIARAEGAQVIATTRAPSKRDPLAQAGAHHVIVTSDEDVVARVREITGGHGADVLFDAIAGPGFEALCDAMADGGRLVVYGYLGGLRTPLSWTPLLRKGLTVRASSIVRTTTNAEAMAEAIRYVQSGVERGAFRPVVDRTFPLAEIVAAHQYLEGSSQVGKIVILP